MPIHKGTINHPRPESENLCGGSVHESSPTRSSTGNTTPPRTESRNTGQVSPPKVEEQTFPVAIPRRRSSMWKKLISGPLPAGPDAKMPGTKSGPRKLQRKPSKNRK